MVFVLLTPVRPALVTNARDPCDLLVLLISGVEAFVVLREDLVAWPWDLPQGFPFEAWDGYFHARKHPCPFFLLNERSLGG